MHCTILVQVNREGASVKRSTKAILILSAIAVFILLAVMVMIPFIIITPMVQPVTFARTFDPEEFGLNAYKMTLVTQDQLALEAYLVNTDSPKAVVIFVSGIHNPPVSAFFGHSRMLADHGYASLLVEMRAHGNSEGNRIALGYEEHLDVLAAVDTIKADEKLQDLPIVAFGLSMGGAVAINSAGVIPDIDAVISLSAFSAWEDVFIDNMTAMGAPNVFAGMLKPFVKLYITITFGPNSLTLSPKHQIAQLGDRPILLVHSRKDSQVPYASFERLKEAAPPHAQTWVRDGDLHFIVDQDAFLTPEKDDQYREVILDFLKQVL